jgi:hypothetical protein
MPHEKGRAEVERREHTGKVIGEDAPVVSVARLAVAVAPDVEAEDARPGPQRKGDRVPEGGQEAGRMDEEDRLALAAPVEEVEAEAVRFNEEVTRS